MRLIKVSAPEGRGEDVARAAFSVGIEKVSVHQTKSLHSDGKTETKDSVDVETSTPKGKRFVDAVLAADFYDPSEFSIAVRQPRSIISKAGASTMLSVCIRKKAGTSHGGTIEPDRSDAMRGCA